MSIDLTPGGLGVDCRTDLPFNNSVAVRFQIGTVHAETANPFFMRQNTHLWLLFRAASLLDCHSMKGQQVCSLVKPVEGELNDPLHDALCRGLWDADKSPRYNDPLVTLIPTWVSHFYDPDTGTNWRGDPFPNALGAGSHFYRLSLHAYRANNPKQAGYWLGLALHYLTNLTQPMHAANFTWISSHAFGYHTDFERYVKNALTAIAPPGVYTPLLSQTAYRAYFHAAARYSKDTYYAALCKPEWTQRYTDTARTEAIWESRVGALVPSILADAVQVTAQFLLMWLTDAASSHRAFSAPAISQARRKRSGDYSALYRLKYKPGRRFSSV